MGRRSLAVAGAIVLAAFSACRQGTPVQVLDAEMAKVRDCVPALAVMAHRGSTYWTPEETESAWRWARETGADYLESDLQCTRDGIILANHDENLTRTTDIAEVFGEGIPACRLNFYLALGFSRADAEAQLERDKETFRPYYAASYYYGGPYNYGNYAVPTEPSDILIWFSGSDDGAYFMDNYARSIHEFGYNCAALFNFRDIQQAILFAEKLPEGSRIIVRGHSMGASAAFRFAEMCQREILLLDTRDPTSWFNHPKSKPSNVVHWRNVLPGEPYPRVPESRHMDTFYFCNFNMANVFRLMGRPWNQCNGALNLILPACDHHDVGENID